MESAASSTTSAMDMPGYSRQKFSPSSQKMEQATPRMLRHSPGGACSELETNVSKNSAVDTSKPHVAYVESRGSLRPVIGRPSVQPNVDATSFCELRPLANLVSTRQQPRGLPPVSRDEAPPRMDLLPHSRITSLHSRTRSLGLTSHRTHRPVSPHDSVSCSESHNVRLSHSTKSHHTANSQPLLPTAPKAYTVDEFKKLLDLNEHATTQFHRKSIGDWDFVKTIGAGSMGKVKLAQHNRTGEMCAVKIVPRAAKLYQRDHACDAPPINQAESDRRKGKYEKEVARDKRTIREGALGRLLFHPYICRLYEMVPMTNHYYMLFELVEGGQMLDYIVAHGSLKERIARQFGRGIASALVYCHKNNVVHRDLKIENIMINEKGDVKIIDFGLSNLYSPNSLLKTYCGSLYFAAPELLCAKPYTGPEVDVWSFGVVLYVLLCGKVPFDDTSVPELHEKIKKGKVEYPDFLSSECVSLLLRMLVVDPTKRATLYEVCQHPWMNRGYDTGVLSYVPPRVPLTLPLDPEIIKTIAAFDLGTPSQIAEDLKSILTSVPYQLSCENWQNVTRMGKEYDSASNARILGDPTAGFHPLISIYYLVSEMRKRKLAKEEALRRQAIARREHSLSTQKPIPAMNSIQYSSPSVLRGDLPRDVLKSSQQPPFQAVPQLPVPATPDLPVPVTPLPHTPLNIQHRGSPQIPSSVLRIPFPEQSHASSIMASFEKSERSSPVIQLPDIPSKALHPQQPISPREQYSCDFADVSALKSPGSGINSLLRRLSAKKPGTNALSHKTASGATEAHADARPLPKFETVNPDDRVKEKLMNDSMMRRGVSMKVTAREKLLNERGNISDPLSDTLNSPTYNSSSKKCSIGHSRTSSGSGIGKSDNVVPMGTVPPLPSLNVTNLSITPQTGRAYDIQPNTKHWHDGAVDNVGRKLHPNARAKSVGEAMRKDSSFNIESYSKPPLPNLMATQNSDDDVDLQQRRLAGDGFFDNVTLSDVDVKRFPQLSEDKIMEQFANAASNSMPSIEHCKTLFLKGFFSVQTTSTKQLPVIRYNIIRVLSRLGVKFQEVKGGFVCEHSPSLQILGSSESAEPRELNNVAHSRNTSTAHSISYPDDYKLIALRSDSSSQELESEHLYATDVGHTERTPRRNQSLNVGNRPLSPLPNHGAVFNKTHRSSNSFGGHRRKASAGNPMVHPRKRSGSHTAIPPNTPAAVRSDCVNDDMYGYAKNAHQNAFDDSIDSLNGVNVGGGSDMLVSSRVEHRARHQHSVSLGGLTSRVQRSPLKFEIHIVKVPLVGLHGVQFKKLLGNTWNYKTLADQILTEVNL